MRRRALLAAAAVGAAPRAAAFGTLCPHDAAPAYVVPKMGGRLRAPPAPRAEAACCDACCTAFCSQGSGSCYAEQSGSGRYATCAPKPAGWVAPCCAAGGCWGQWCSTGSQSCYTSESSDRYCRCPDSNPGAPTPPAGPIPGDTLPRAGTKAAFLGDAGSGSGQRQVLEMVKEWGAQFVVHSGDFEYRDDAELFEKQLDDVLGPDYPYFANIGNHDIGAWTADDAPVQRGGGHKDRLEARLRRFGGDQACAGELGVNMVCHWEGLTFVLSGVGTLGTGHVDYIEKAFTANPSAWRMCTWHKNQRLMQVGGKSNEVGWAPYEACREHGAILHTAHEHSYCRSYNMRGFSDSPTVAARRRRHDVETFPGQSFVWVSGLAGNSVRSHSGGLQDSPWWAAWDTSNSGADYGAVLCTFHVDGDPRKADCEFRDIQGRVRDRFAVFTRNGDGVPRNATRRADAGRVVELPVGDAGGDFTTDAAGAGRDAAEAVITVGPRVAGLVFDAADLDGARRVREARLQVYGAAEGAGEANVTVWGLLPGGGRTRHSVEWTAATGGDEFGERHEVWVSADLSGLVNEQLAAGAAQLTFRLQSSGAPRSFYARDRSPCYAPHLWVDLPTR